MNSPIKLPALPTVDIDGKKVSQVWFRAHEVRAYAEQAVRDALAAQVPVAWLYHDGKPGIVPFPDDLSASMAVSLTRRPEWRNETPLAIIPENKHGDTP